MKKQIEEALFQEYDQNDRIELLRDNCDKCENTIVKRHLIEDEIIQWEHNLSQKTIELKKIQLQFDDVKREFTKKMKPIEEAITNMAEVIEAGTITYKGEVFEFIDEDAGMVGIYDLNGRLVTTRQIAGAQKSIIGEARKTITPNHNFGDEDSGNIITDDQEQSEE